MHIVIINSSPRAPTESNTTKIIDAFQEGISSVGATAEIYCLAERSQWDAAKNALRRAQNIIFALPLYVEIVPGILLEFLEQLSNDEQFKDGAEEQRKMSFILQSAFPEACQRRCCERYLQMLPSLLNCRYSGILSHGDTFNLSFVESVRVNMFSSYMRLGEQFVKSGGNFFFKEAVSFNGGEYMAEEEAKGYNRLLKFFFQHAAEAKGCKEKLTYKPYLECNEWK